MAAEGMPLIIPGGGAGADIVSGRSPVTRPAPGLASPTPARAGALDDAAHSGRSARGSSSPSDAGTAGGGSRRANSSASQAAQSSADRSSASDGSRGGSGGAGSGSPADPAGNSRCAKTGNSGADSGSGRQSAGAATQGRGAPGASSGGAAQAAAQGTAQAAAGAKDFAAALAQSLAATPAGGAATTDTAATQSRAADAGESSESHARHSDADPVSSALALLEQALTGALAAAQSTPPVAGTPATSTSGASSPAGGTIAAAGNGGATALTVLLAHDLASETHAGGTNPASAGGSAASAASAASATAVTASTAAALTAAAQLSSGSQIGSQHGMTDSSRMALASSVGTSAWTDELGTKLTWMAHQGIESASLQLSPEHLGPLQVTISVHDGQASVWFGAAQPDTRTALQQSLPQLRQLFVNQGLTLADAGVSREPPRGQSRQNSARSTAPVSGIAAVTGESPGTRATITGGLGLLDTYA